MKLTFEQLNSIFTDAKLNHDIAMYIAQADETLPSYIDGINVSLDGIQYYFEGFEEEIIEEINNLIGVDLSNWNESKKYEDNYFEDFLQDMLNNFNHDRDMEW